MQQILSKKTFQWLALFLLALVWGSSFILMKRGLDSFSYVQVASLRIFIAFVSLFPFVFRWFKLLRGKKLLPIFISGLLGNTFPAFLFTKAQTMLPSSYAGMLNSLTPLFTLLLGLALFGVKTKWFNILGICVGLAGAIGLINANGLDLNSPNLIYSLYAVGAALCYAISVNVIKRYLHDVNSLAITALSFFCVGPLMIVPLYQTDVLGVLFEKPESWRSLGFIVFLAVIGTSAAVVLFNNLIKHTTAMFAASVTYLIPVVAILWGVFDGEAITLYHLLFVGVILAGIYLVNFNRS